jgi:hypothetical protein
MERKKASANVEAGTASVIVDWTLGAAERFSAIGSSMPTNTTPTAVEIATGTIANIRAALAILSPASPAMPALQASLAEAEGMLALAEAEAGLQAQRLADIAAVEALPASLSAEVKAAMLAAIEAHYAPAPIVEPLAEPAAPASGKKPVSARTAAINASAATVGSERARANLAAFDATFAGDLSGVARTSGTRFCSLAAFGGDGVTGSADYQSVVAQIRHFMRYTLGVSGSGDSYATAAWLFATGIHSPGSAKGTDSLPLKFLSRASVALFADGRFRLALPGTPNVRFVARDTAALAQWHGTAVAALPATPVVTVAAPATPTAPAVAASATGAMVAVASCQHCSIRNAVGAPACKICKAEDWNAGA